jgi:hypothetical protein
MGPDGLMEGIGGSLAKRVQETVGENVEPQLMTVGGGAGRTGRWAVTGVQPGSFGSCTRTARALRGAGAVREPREVWAASNSGRN